MEHETLRPLVIEVLDGTMQNRYFENPSPAMPFQFHPNYVNPNSISFGHQHVSESPWNTRKAVRAAFMLRWIGLNAKPKEAVDEEAAVPGLVDMSGEPIQYGDLQPDKTFSLLEHIALAESSNTEIAATPLARRAMLAHPNQKPMILPAKGRLFHGFRRGIQVHRLYNELLFGDADATPTGMTKHTSDVEKRRLGFTVIDGGSPTQSHREQ